MNNFSEFLADMRGKRIDVIGLGISNEPLVRLLLSAGACVTVRDKRPYDALKSAPAMLDLGAKLICGPEYLGGLDGDIVFRTPGMRPDLPELLRAEANGSVITSEMECFFELCPCPIIGVTGSDGKTTTTTLISKILEAAGRVCHLGGNIGRPLLSDIPSFGENDIAAVELSSFQLFTMKRSPHIAVITNISPNHLDIHRDMEEYVSAKENIFLHQNASDTLILNADNASTERFAEKACGNVLKFSRTRELDRGIFLRGSDIIYRDGTGDRLVMPVSDILLPGVHNIENYLAAAAATLEYADFSNVSSVARTFAGVKHRIELVREKNGVRYYNDSIASSPTRTLAGLRSFSDPVILIAGGYDKHISFDELGRELPGLAKVLILTGDTADKIAAAVGDGMTVMRASDLSEAVNMANGLAVPGDVILMSPACASFDRYKNFEERGEHFRSLVLAL